MGRNKRDAADYAIHAILLLLAACMIFPFYNVIIVSFGESAAMAKQTVYLIPTSFDFSAYRLILNESRFLDAFLVTGFVTVAGTAINLAVTLSGAYVLSKPELPGKKWILSAILFTMFFNGGLIPFYLTVKNLGLINHLFAMILPVTVNTFYLIICIAFFRTLPAALEESAKLDGANDIQILLRIVLPVSMPMVATITLFYAVDRWNEWWNGMLFMTDIKLLPLQSLLREIMVNYSQIMQNVNASSILSQYGTLQPVMLKMAVLVITALPIVCLYPFLQKYFAKGVMIGAIKG